MREVVKGDGGASIVFENVGEKKKFDLQIYFNNGHFLSLDVDIVPTDQELFIDRIINSETGFHYFVKDQERVCVSIKSISYMILKEVK